MKVRNSNRAGRLTRPADAKRKMITDARGCSKAMLQSCPSLTYIHSCTLLLTVGKVSFSDSDPQQKHNIPDKSQTHAGTDLGVVSVLRL